jgi:hypothetical protein
VNRTFFLATQSFEICEAQPESTVSTARRRQTNPLITHSWIVLSNGSASRIVTAKRSSPRLSQGQRRDDGVSFKVDFRMSDT